MPNYSYQCEKYHITRVFKQMGETKAAWLSCSECEERAYRVWGMSSASTKGWPYVSDALGCHPDQIKEQAQSLLEAGIPTQFTKDGGLILQDNQHRNAVMAHNGIFDRDASYGQRTVGAGVPDYFKDEIESHKPEPVGNWIPEDM